MNQEHATPTEDANAHLIAAAPEMLETLQFVLDYSIMGFAEYLKKYPDCPVLTDAVQAIIAKAQGK